MVSQVANAIHNARLFEQTQAALSETATLYNASRRITEAGELQEIVTAVVDEIPVPDINRVVLWDLERDESGQVVAFIVRGGWHSGEGTSIMPVGTRLSTAQLPATRLVMRPEPLFFDNVQQDERIDPAARAMLRQQNIRGMGVLPLWSSGQQVGALLLESEVPHHFSESEIRPYRALSGQIAAAVENRRLFEENVRRAEELAALNRLAEVVSTSLEQQALLPSALETLLEVLDFEIGLFSLQDAESGRLLLAAQQGLPRSMAERFEREGMEGTLCDFVFRTREALCLGDVREEAPVDVRGLIEHGLLAYAGLPVLYKGECLGTICFFDTSVRHMSAADLLLLEDMGRQIGVGLENTRLFRQTQQALAEVEAARREAQEALAEAEAVHRRYLQREWRSFLTTSAAVQLQGFQAGPEGTKLLSDEQLFEGKDVERRRLAVPIKLRGQTIGLIDLTRDDEGEWSEGDQALVESFSENLALAIENTRLFEQTQHRAARERLTREITDKIRGQTDLGAILQTTVQELGKVLGTSQAAIRLGTEQELTSSPGGARSSKD
ncbi:MAG: hypothetical protein B6I34_01130 [Anaerolineaceae bacterium 4572_32.1]|nr:MAG: hypothetical protein B6I34_01130 [Anaerolineaceae bacterium 4572_32.1]